MSKVNKQKLSYTFECPKELINQMRKFGTNPEPQPGDFVPFQAQIVSKDGSTYPVGVYFVDTDDKLWGKIQP